MYLLYVDASGTPELGQNGDVYALLGICVHEGTWFALEKRVQGLKRYYSMHDAPIELHAKDFCVRIKEQEEIPDFASLDREARRHAVEVLRAAKLAKEVDPDKRENRKKRYRPTKAFTHLTRGERSALLEKGLDLVGSHDGIRLFGEVVDKPHLFRMTGERDAKRHAFSQLVSRFDTFLTRHNGHAILDKGLILMDRDPTAEAFITEQFKKYRTSGHPWGQINHVIETPFYVNSADVAAVQAVDLCAYAVRRHVEHVVDTKGFETANFNRVFHKFEREGARLHGIRHYCQRASCQCRICVERGHSVPEELAAIPA